MSRKKRDCDEENCACTVALAGNPNVGKSTLFNSLTGLHQHTGNWTGKTVSCAQGSYRYRDKTYTLVDLPGTYSIHPHAAEEQAAHDYLCNNCADVVAVVCDATSLERQLILVLQLMQLSDKPMIVLVNFVQEAQRRGKRIKRKLMQAALGVPVLCIEARNKKSVDRVRDAFCELSEISASEVKRTPILSPSSEPLSSEQIVALADKISSVCTQEEREDGDARDRRLDRIFTGKWTGFSAMLVLLALLFWITMAGANGISDRIMSALARAETWLHAGAMRLRVPPALADPLLLGIFRTVAWVVSVMLPPMAIFFPLFTILEDLGYLPRMAFNLDRCFASSHSCGKQALTMCMGLGCHAVGVTGCRIIDSPRDRRIAMLTTSMVPCNGRLPTLTTLVALFFVSATGLFSTLQSALWLTLAILVCVAMTLACSRLLSYCVFRGESSSFLLELPPYRMPRVGQVILRSVLDRTLLVLGRAVAVAAPAGLVLWGLANVSVGETTLLTWLSSGLDGIGKCMGMDGAILLAFVLSLPANELFLPILIMIYHSGGALEPLSSLQGLRTLLLEQGWTTVTAVSVTIFLLFHWPCATTLLTVKKESGSWRYALLSAALPTVFGAVLCLCISGISHIIR